MPFTITINGSHIELSDVFNFDMTLLDFLRGEIKNKDAKCGCNKGFCGSCTVIVNGQAKKSCVLKLKTLNNAEIKTASYINNPGITEITRKLHENGAVQCGFCFPGIVCSLEAKIGNIKNPSREEIINALSGHICRCTGYHPIINSLLGINDRNTASNCNNDNFNTANAASKTNDGSGNINITGTGNATLDNEHIVGTSPIRGDSLPKLLGRAQYADDIDFDGMLHIAILRSEFQFAKIISVNTAEAEKTEGVVKIITGKDLPGISHFGAMRHDQPVLCLDTARFKGDAIAMVIAKTKNQAEAAKKLIKVNCEPFEPIDDINKALLPDAKLIHDGISNKIKYENNTLTEINLKQDAELNSSNVEDIKNPSGHADIVKIKGHFITSPVEHAYMEPESSAAIYDETTQKIKIFAGSQNIHADRLELAEILGMPPDMVEVEFVYCGGGFGGKEDLTTQPYSALGAYFTHKPCKYTFTRAESILCSTKKHPFDIDIEISADASGKFNYISVTALSDIGPYASLSEIVLTRFATHILGPYQWPAYSINVKGVLTNNFIAGAMRGFGVNQACFALESMIDRLARKLNISPLKIREINMVRDGIKFGLGEIASCSNGLRKAFDSVKKHININEIEEFNKNNTNKKRTYAIALAHKNIGLGNNSPRDISHAKIEIKPNQKALIVYNSGSDIGQGLFNVLRQIAAEKANLPIEKIIIGPCSTSDVPTAGVTSASRQTFMSGNAVFHAVDEFYRKLSQKIAQNFNISTNSFNIDGEKINWLFNSCQTAGRIKIYENINTIWDYIDTYEKQGFSITFKYDAPLTMPFAQRNNPDFKSHFGYSFAAHGVILETDLDNKTFKVLKIIAGHDVGRIINPLMLNGQIIGGVVMGLGYTVSELCNMKDGGIDKRELAGLGLLKAAQVPEIEVITIEEPLANAPFGARGIGEISTVPVSAAICNALSDATGEEYNCLPLSLNDNGYKFIN